MSQCRAQSHHDEHQQDRQRQAFDKHLIGIGVQVTVGNTYADNVIGIANDVIGLQACGKEHVVLKRRRPLQVLADFAGVENVRGGVIGGLVKEEVRDSAARHPRDVVPVIV